MKPLALQNFLPSTFSMLLKENAYIHQNCTLHKIKPPDAEGLQKLKSLPIITMLLAG